MFNPRCTIKTYVGVDYHKRLRSATVMDEEGHVLKQGRVAITPRAVAAFLDGS